MATAAVIPPLVSSTTRVANTRQTQTPELLVSSPYQESGHLLDLSTLDPQSRLFAIALTKLRTRTVDYATVKYEESLDLDQLLVELKYLLQQINFKWQQQEFYVVEFRSQLKSHVDNALLFKLDKESHREANISGGLLKYWYGEPNPDRKNLATCFWTSKEAAIAGGKGPIHKQARAIIPRMYESINVKGLRFTIEDDVSSWNLGPYH